MKFKPYPKYKPSGVAWIGDIPDHWEIRRFKMVVTQVDKKIDAIEDEKHQYIGMEDVESWTGRLWASSNATVPLGTANAFKAGNILFGKLRPYLAKACIPETDGICSTEFLVLNSHGLNKKFLLYTLLTEGMVKLVDSSTYGSKMPRASWDFIGDCRVPIVPLGEQGAIFKFLESRVAKLEALIEKKQTLIERLKEKRTALISRTVTKGLPPQAARAAGLPVNPKMKDSGIEWLGAVPDHWELKRLGYLFRFYSGGTPSTGENDLWDGSLPWVSSKDMKSMIISNTEDHISEEAVTVSSTCKLPSGTLLMVNRSGILRHSLPSAVIACEMAINQDIRGCVPLRGVEAKFVSYLIQGKQEVLLSLWRQQGATVESLNFESVKACRILLPPLTEQRAIVAFLDIEMERIDALLVKGEAAILRLQEYRTALITAAVTGKIDVTTKMPDKDTA